MYRVTLSFEAKDTDETDLLINAMSDGFTTAVTKLGNGSLNIYTVEEDEPENILYDVYSTGTFYKVERALELAGLDDNQRSRVITEIKGMNLTFAETTVD